MSYSEGDRVKWWWGYGTAEGVIDKVYTRKTTRTFKGAAITKNATKACPAYMIRLDDGARTLRLHTEVERG
jgi:hypothetical protein